VVGVAAAGVANAEVEVRALRRALAGGSDGPEGVAGVHPLALAHGRGGQMEVRGVEAAVAGPDADRQAG
jgi:hypothetical protein